MDYHESKAKERIYELCLKAINESHKYKSLRLQGNPYAFAGEKFADVPSAIRKMIDNEYPNLKSLMEK